MTAPGGAKIWFTAAEIAALGLPGLPKVKRKVNELAAAEGWAFREGLARPRAARGGGLEYHLDLLPPRARAKLAPAIPVAPAPDSNVVPLRAAERPESLDWAWFERQSEDARAIAAKRAGAIAAVEALERAGRTRCGAVRDVCEGQGISAASLWQWIALVGGVGGHDRLPILCPRRVGGGVEADIDADLWAYFKSDYLRPEKPSMASVYERVKGVAAGRPIPHIKTFRRKLEREVDARVILAKRTGAEALRRSLPPQQRSVAALGALDLVNIDGHKWDVFVKWPDGRVGRPMMVAIQDVYSRKFLGWRIGATENVGLTRLAFADVFKGFGIPGACLLDNGRAFASKAITGGAKTRFRFKIRDEDPAGLLTALGVEIHWATPYRGQSKPIERAFRDLCDHGAKHPAFAGAYTGNKPDAKPENYGETAIPLEVFTRVAAKIMAAHNARVGRRTEMARGGSFDEAFAASYASAVIRKATPAHLRMALLAADQVTADKSSGAISMFGNRYWTDALHSLAGRKVTVRFDPDALHSEIHVYDLDGRYLTAAPVIETVGFLDVDAAKARAKQEAEWRRSVRRAAELEDLLSPDQLARMLPDDDGGTGAMPEPSIIRPVRPRGNVGAAAAARAPLIDRLDFEDLVPAREARAALRLVE